MRVDGRKSCEGEPGCASGSLWGYEDQDQDQDGDQTRKGIRLVIERGKASLVTGLRWWGLLGGD